MSRRLCFWGSFTLIAVLGALWVIVTPMMGEPDEAAHAQRAAAVGQGQLRWSSRYTEVDDEQTYVRTYTEVQVPKAYADLDQLVPRFLFSLQPASSAPPIPTGTETATARVYTGTYPPFAYLGIGWLTRVAPAPVALYLMRMLGMLACAALLASGFVAARDADASGITVVGALAALTPTLLWQSAGIGPTGLELCAAWCLWSSLLALFSPAHPPEAALEGRLDDRMVWRAVIAATVLVTARPLGPGYGLAVVVVVSIAAARRERSAELVARGSTRIGLVVVGLAAVAAIAWDLVAHPFGAIMGRPLPGLPLANGLVESAIRVPRRMTQMIGVLGWLDTPVPTIAVVAWGVVVVALFVAGMWFGDARRRIALALLAVAVLVGPVVAEAMDAASFGFVWQGRYTLPLAAGIPILGAWSVGRSRRAERLVSSGAPAVMIIGLVTVHVLAVAVALTRWNTGSLWPIEVPLGGLPWAPEVPGAAVVGVALVGYAALAIWCIALSRNRASALP